MSNFCARIADAAARFPTRPAVERLAADGALYTTTYRDLLREAQQFAGGLSGRGLGRGDRAAILADNDARWIAAYLGTLWIGGVAVPLDTAYKAAQVRTVLESSGARVLFTTRKYQETAQAAVEGTHGDSRTEVVLLDEATPGLETPGAMNPPMTDVSPADAAVMLYTSGTTADPKGVVLTHANLDAERAAAVSVVHPTERDAVLGVLPLFHALAQMANLLIPLAVGARVVFLESVNSTTLLGALESRGITIFACVPQFFYLIHQRVTAEVAKSGAFGRRMFRALIGANVWLRDHVGWNPGRRVFKKVHHTLGPSMRVLVTGGSRFDPAIGRDLYGMGFTLLNAYGLTETSGGATIQRAGDRFNTSVGVPMEGVEVRIKTSEVSSGAVKTEKTSEVLDGEILIRGPIVMREYYKRPDATAESLRDGWLHTGDLGRLDADGRLYITGRLKEIVVLASGKNLYPEEIEAHYRQSSFIKELAVLGLARPGEPAAERLHAVVVPDAEALRQRGTVNVGDLVRFELETLSVQLPAHKRILSYDVSLDPLPRTTTGKLRRPDIERRAQERAASAVRGAEAPVSEADRAWLDQPDHAPLMAVIAARLPQSAVRPDANLDLDLGLDSMERVELLTLLEQRQGTHVRADVRATIFTVRQLVDAVRAGARAGDATTREGRVADDTWETVLAAPPDPVLAESLSTPKPALGVVMFCVIRLAAVAARVCLKFRATGLEQLPRTGPFIICPNHQASIDPLFICAVLPRRALAAFFAVGAAEHFQTPFTAWLARTLNIVPVDPDANLVAAMQAGAAGLRLGKVLVIFPEGERSIDGEIKPFRKGAAILAGQLDVPIVPVGLDGLFALWPRGRAFNWRGLLPWRSAPVTLRFGTPLHVARGAYAEGTDALQRQVRDLLAEIRTTQAPRV